MIFFHLFPYTVSVWNWCNTYHLLVVFFVLVFLTDVWMFVQILKKSMLHNLHCSKLLIKAEAE